MAGVAGADPLEAAMMHFGTLRGESVAVKTVFTDASDCGPLVLQRRRHVLLNNICMQQLAADQSLYVCKVVGLCWEKTRVHIAMPRYTETLEEHVMAVHIWLSAACGPDRTLALCLQLTRAVSAVHSCGFLHCDVNPGNVLLAEDGTPRLTGFGMSHVARAELKTRSTDGPTRLYAPLQQQVEARVNNATDMYALGRTLAFAAAGARPLRADDGEKMPSEVEELRDLLKRMTFDPDQQEMDLLTVIDEFRQLRDKYGPPPVRARLVGRPCT